MAKILSIIRVIVKRHRENITFKNYRNLKGWNLVIQIKMSVYMICYYDAYIITRKYGYENTVTIENFNYRNYNLIWMSLTIICVIWKLHFDVFFFLAFIILCLFTLLLYSIIALLHCQQTDHLSQLPLFLLISSWKAVLTASFVLMNKRIPYCRWEKNRVELYGIIIFN